MAELTVKKVSTWVPVRVNEDGRPYCSCNCGELMVEVSPGAFQCPDGVAVDQYLRERIAPLIAAALGDEPA